MVPIVTMMLSFTSMLNFGLFRILWRHMNVTYLEAYQDQASNMTKNAFTCNNCIAGQ